MFLLRDGLLTLMNIDSFINLERFAPPFPLYLYYDMKLVMLGIDSQKNLIIQFPVFVQPSTQTKLTLYQIETVPVPILDTNNKVQCYTQLKIEKPYIALNDETYISLCTPELNTCKRIGYEYFCKELFVVKSKHKYSCATTVYFNSNHDIKEHCDFRYYFNKSNVTPSVLDRGHQIILVNWPHCKRIICTYNNNIPVNIPSHPYILLDRNILCNCDIEAKSNFLLETLEACRDYIKEKTLKDFIHQYQENRRIDNQRKMNQNSRIKTFINSFITDLLVFIAAILTILIMFTIIYTITGQSKL